MKTCGRCKTEHDSRWKMCDRCRLRQREYTRAFTSGGSTAGSCIHCGDPLGERQSRCCGTEECRTKEAAAKHERHKARLRERYAEDAEYRAATLERNALWREENRELLRALLRSQYAASPERRESVKEAAKRRRALMRSATVVSFSPSALEARLSMYARCWICKVASPAHVDHVKPLSKGGAHMLANLRPACQQCNIRKGAKWPFNPEE